MIYNAHNYDTHTIIKHQSTTISLVAIVFSSSYEKSSVETRLERAEHIVCIHSTSDF